MTIVYRTRSPVPVDNFPAIAGVMLLLGIAYVLIEKGCAHRGRVPGLDRGDTSGAYRPVSSGLC